MPDIMFEIIRSIEAKDAFIQYDFSVQLIVEKKTSTRSLKIVQFF